ncbi:hypothetical protein [Streptomyces mirabilis]|uniref:SbtR family transcriptional regulator n=1 Tax=Streptomyces mirabilis TaxID=68239 RepID=UPI00338E3A90
MAIRAALTELTRATDAAPGRLWDQLTGPGWRRTRAASPPRAAAPAVSCGAPRAARTACDLCDATPHLLETLPPEPALRAFLQQLVVHSAASRSTAVALKAGRDLGSPVFARARASMIETIGRLMTAAVAPGAIRADVTPLLFDGLRDTATAPRRSDGVSRQVTPCGRPECGGPCERANGRPHSAPVSASDGRPGSPPKTNRGTRTVPSPPAPFRGLSRARTTRTAGSRRRRPPSDVPQRPRPPRTMCPRRPRPGRIPAAARSARRSDR